MIISGFMNPVCHSTASYSSCKNFYSLKGDDMPVEYNP